MMNTYDIREYFDNILLGNPEEIIDNLSIIEDHFFYVVNFINENNEDYIYSICLLYTSPSPRDCS